MLIGMSDENIRRITQYLQQNSNQTTDMLVQNLITAGYQQEDIGAALEQLGLSPLAIPDYAPPTSEPKLSELVIPGKGIVAFMGAAIILIAVYFLGNPAITQLLEKIPLLGRPPQLSRPVKTDEVPIVTPEIDAPVTESPPRTVLNTFIDTYNKGTFKVTLAAKQLPITDIEEFQLEYYTENGFVDRFDNTAGITTIVVDNAYYTINHNSKTFTKVDSTDLQYNPLVQSLQDSFILNELLFGLESETLSWQEIEPNTWKITIKDSGTYITVTFDEKALPNLIMMYDAKDVPTYQYVFSFEPIIITEELLSVPSGYKEEIP